jgi:hypothetical protein
LPVPLSPRGSRSSTCHSSDTRRALRGRSLSPTPAVGRLR